MQAKKFASCFCLTSQEVLGNLRKFKKGGKLMEVPEMTTWRAANQIYGPRWNIACQSGPHLRLIPLEVGFVPEAWRTITDVEILK